MWHRQRHKNTRSENITTTRYVPTSPRTRARRRHFPRFLRPRARIETCRPSRDGSRSRHVAHWRHSQPRGFNNSSCKKIILLSHDFTSHAISGSMVRLRGRKHRHLEERVGGMVLRRKCWRFVFSSSVLIRAKRAKISVALFSFREDKIRELRANISGELTNTFSL